MSARPQTSTAEPRLPFDSCPDVCGNLERPGAAIDVPLWVDHTGDETTVDQARIEDALERLDPAGKNVLHVGVGNSSLARRFAGRARRIDGLTVSANELAMAEALGLANYRVQLLSKHCRDLLARLPDRYDFLVDNNLASYACCKYHFYLMFDNYLAALRPDGRVLTDQRGMDFAAADRRWWLTWDDLVALESRLPIRAGRLTDTVYEIRRSREPPPPPPPAPGHLRQRGGA